MIKFLATTVCLLLAIIFGIVTATTSPEGIFASSSPPEGCTEVTSAYYSIQGKYRINVSATFSMEPDYPNFITIKNIKLDYGGKEFAKTFCIVPNNANVICLKEEDNFEQPLRFPLQNETLTSLFNIQIIVNNTMSVEEEVYEYILFEQIFDEGFFSLDSGEIFSDTQSCFGYSEYDRHNKLRLSLSQCCSSFKPVHQYPNNVTTTCQKFKSRITIYNVDDNYSIFSTTQVNYTLAGGNWTVVGGSKGPKDLDIWIALNNHKDCKVTNDSNDPCIFKLPSGDSRFLINAEYENSTNPIDYDSILQRDTKLVGRLIFRNGVALMAESDPFTPENNCQYFNLDLPSNQVISSAFCCTEF